MAPSPMRMRSTRSVRLPRRASVASRGLGTVQPCGAGAADALVGSAVGVAWHCRRRLRAPVPPAAVRVGGVHCGRPCGRGCPRARGRGRPPPSLLRCVRILRVSLCGTSIQRDGGLSAERAGPPASPNPSQPPDPLTRQASNASHDPASQPTNPAHHPSREAPDPTHDIAGSTQGPAHDRAAQLHRFTDHRPPDSDRAHRHRRRHGRGNQPAGGHRPTGGHQSAGAGG